MPKQIPVIRAAALGPYFIWMQQNHRSVEQALERAELGYITPDEPLKVVPLHNLSRLLINEARELGPGFLLRMAAETSALTDAMIGPFLANEKTPRDALNRVSGALPYLSSHEHLAIEDGDERTIIRHFWGAMLDAEAVHYLQQWTAAMIELLFRQLNSGREVRLQIAMLPHPIAGLDHVRAHLQSEIVPGTKILTTSVKRGLVDSVFRGASPSSAAPKVWPGLDNLRAHDGLAGTARLLIRAMLEIRTPTSAQLARAAGLSLRTLQRGLEKEGTSFSRLLDEVRRDAALEWLELDAGSLADLSNALGYSHPTAFTRAMHRWAGKSPREMQAQTRKYTAE